MASERGIAGASNSLLEEYGKDVVAVAVVGVVINVENVALFIDL